MGNRGLQRTEEWVGWTLSSGSCRVQREAVGMGAQGLQVSGMSVDMQEQMPVQTRKRK